MAGMALVAACVLLATPAPALAEDIDTNPIPDEFQLEVERTAAEYEQAVANVDEASRKLDENRARIAELEEAIPAQESRSGAAAREQYKLQQQGSGVIDLLLSADSFYDFIVSFEYVNRISEANLAEMNRLTEMKAELDEAQSALKLAKREADANVEAAGSALAAAQEARAEAQRRAQEEAQRQAEAAAAAAAAEAAAQAEAHAAEEEEPDTQSDENQDVEAEPGAASAASADEDADGAEPEGAGEDTAATAPSNDGADWSADQAAFVDEWAARIDAYLAGSPMAGQGRTFAVAAWAYGVDPRWSPAIACIESSKGAACFNPHNAWGWGSSSWGSWEEAIDEHVRGLARGYGYTISIEAAQKYCPPNWQKWYENTSAQMNLI